jgi:hypothetical protein
MDNETTETGSMETESLQQTMSEAAGGAEPTSEAQPPAETPPTSGEAATEAPAETKATTGEEAPSDNRMRDALRALGEIPEKPNETLMESIDASSIEKLPASAKGVLKHLMAQQKSEHRKLQEQVSKREQDLKDYEAKLQNDARALIRNRAQLNQVLLDPKFQELLKAADIGEEDLGDPLTEEGMKNRVNKQVATAMREFQRPITEAAHKAQQMAAYNDFVEGHPKMQDRGFKREVRELMSKRQSAQQPVSLEDAYALTERRRLLDSERTRVQTERKARQQSSRQVGRKTQSGQPDPGDPVPDWVTKKGYQGVRGYQARIRYLRDNPKALERLRSMQKSRRR